MPCNWLERIDVSHSLPTWAGIWLKRLNTGSRYRIYKGKTGVDKKENSRVLHYWLLRREKDSKLCILQKGQKVGYMESNWEDGTGNYQNSKACL
jgi:hypothetical protein